MFWFWQRWCDVMVSVTLVCCRHRFHCHCDDVVVIVVIVTVMALMLSSSLSLSSSSSLCRHRHCRCHRHHHRRSGGGLGHGHGCVGAWLWPERVPSQNSCQWCQHGCRCAFRECDQLGGQEPAWIYNGMSVITTCGDDVNMHLVRCCLKPINTFGCSVWSCFMQVFCHQITFRFKR